jgi:hypothetical protein
MTGQRAPFLGHIVVGAMPLELKAAIRINRRFVVGTRAHASSPSMPEDVCVVDVAEHNQSLRPGRQLFDQRFIEFRNVSRNARSFPWRQRKRCTRIGLQLKCVRLIRRFEASHNGDRYLVGRGLTAIFEGDTRNYHLAYLKPVVQSPVLRNRDICSQLPFGGLRGEVHGRLRCCSRRLCCLCCGARQFNLFLSSQPESAGRSPESYRRDGEHNCEGRNDGLSMMLKYVNDVHSLRQYEKESADACTPQDPWKVLGVFSGPAIPARICFIHACPRDVETTIPCIGCRGGADRLFNCYASGPTRPCELGLPSYECAARLV